MQALEGEKFNVRGVGQDNMQSIVWNAIGEAGKEDNTNERAKVRASFKLFGYQRRADTRYFQRVIETW